MNDISHEYILYIGGGCKEKCIFCYFDETPKKLEDIRKEISKARESHSRLFVYGGDLFSRTDVRNILLYISNLNFENVAIYTNCWQFRNPDFNKNSNEILLNYFDEVVFPIHAHTHNLHDTIISIKDGLKNTLEGVFILKKSAPHLTLSALTIINRANYRFLPQISDKLSELFVDKWRLIFPVLNEKLLVNFEEVFVTYREIKHKLLDAIRNAKYNNIDVIVGNVPFCNLPFTRVMWDSISSRTKPKQCGGCIFNEVCLGITSSYLKKIGSEEFIPVCHK